MNDARLWKVFSEYIRRRDSDSEGYGKCFTCPAIIFWKDGDCGHGIPRQHKGTKYHEQNNHLQCKKCNGFEGGEQAAYKEEVEKRYGAGTWDKLRLMARQTCKRTKVDIDIMTKHYKSLLENFKS